MFLGIDIMLNKVTRSSLLLIILMTQVISLAQIKGPETPYFVQPYSSGNHANGYYPTTK